MSIKCEVCNIKINKLLAELTNKCRCGNIFCKKHMLNHNCTFDYNKLYLIQKKEELITVKKDKVIKI
jgi:hypothetical protein